MASLKEVKNRINSVQSTRKITSAMKMVASSKLHRAQQNIESMRPYERGLNRMLTTFLAAEQGEVSTPLSEVRTAARVVVVCITSNSSLCGGFNANAIRALKETLAEYEERGAEVVEILTIGRKAAEAVRKMPRYAGCAHDLSNLLDHPAYSVAAEATQALMQRFVEKDLDEVALIYHHFKSAASQVLTKEMLLPLSLADIAGSGCASSDDQKASGESQKASADEQKASGEQHAFALNFLVEPSRQQVIESLLPKTISLKLYTALLDSLASEHAARVIAMQVATDNADELLRELRLTYNKTRQQAITTELLDIVGGSMQ